MTQNSWIAAVVKEQLSKFSGIISKGLPKSKQKLIREMVYGIQAAKDIRVRHYTSIRNMVVLILAVAYFAAVYLGDNLKLKMLMERIYLVSKRPFGAPTFFNYAIADRLYNLLFTDKTGIEGITKARKPDFQRCFSFFEECG